MKRQAWQDLRLRFVISHSLVAGQLYSIFPVSKHRDGHPGIMFSPWIQGQAAVPRHFHHHQSVNVACLLIHLHTHPWRLYPADLAKGMAAVLGFQARVLQACHALCCSPWNLACSLKSRNESGSSSDITRISFAASLAPCLWDGCHLPKFLVLLGQPGSSETAFPPLLPPASWHTTGSREAIGLHWERWVTRPEKWTWVLHANLYIFTLLVLVHLLTSSAQDSFPLPTFLIPFYLWSPLNTAYKTKRERSTPNLFLITSHFIISQEYNQNMDARVW